MCSVCSKYQTAGRSNGSNLFLPVTVDLVMPLVLQEFKNVDGEEYHADMSTVASPASQGSPDVYILPLTEVSLPVAKQPARSGESTAATRWIIACCRHNQVP